MARAARGSVGSTVGAPSSRMPRVQTLEQRASRSPAATDLRRLDDVAGGAPRRCVASSNTAAARPRSSTDSTSRRPAASGSTLTVRNGMRRPASISAANDVVEVLVAQRGQSHARRLRRREGEARERAAGVAHRRSTTLGPALGEPDDARVVRVRAQVHDGAPPGRHRAGAPEHLGPVRARWIGPGLPDRAVRTRPLAADEERDARERGEQTAGSREQEQGIHDPRERSPGRHGPRALARPRPDPARRAARGSRRRRLAPVARTASTLETSMPPRATTGRSAGLPEERREPLGAERRTLLGDPVHGAEDRVVGARLRRARRSRGPWQDTPSHPGNHGRTRSAGGERCPSWTPSAPTASATSARSPTISAAPWDRHRTARSRAARYSTSPLALRARAAIRH